MTNDKKTITTEKSIYQKLLEAVDKLPPEAIERADKELTRKGYDTTGYQYMYLVNVLNEVCGIGGWGMGYRVIKEMEGKWSNGRSYWDITTEVTVWIQDKDNPFALVGGHKSDTYADALKGAITNGFKKTVAMFGVGKKAYEGTLDEDYRAPETPKSQTAKGDYSTKNFGRTTSRAVLQEQTTASLLCDQCKAVITPAERGYSTKNYGRALCRKCQGSVFEAADFPTPPTDEQPFV